MAQSPFETLKEIIAELRLRCPWDKEQTHSSLKTNLLQECYEVLEALDEGDSQRLCQELGDLLMQVLLHSQIAAEAGEFNIDDVIQGISQKLVNRHPHIFGLIKIEEAQQVIAQWDSLKREEGEGSLLAHIPKAMPALAYSQEIQGRAARTGFDWEEIEGIIQKLSEEVEELLKAKDQQDLIKEFGDLLFTLCNIARRAGIDLESALRQANLRFSRRFAFMEELCQRRGLSFSELPLEQKDALWEEAKREII